MLIQRQRVVVVREPEHAPRGDPCSLCGLPASRHRSRKGRGARRREERRLLDLSRPIVGIDGEGVDLPCPRCGLSDRDAPTCPAGDGPCRRGHAYTYLSAVDEDGRKLGSVQRSGGLASHEILAFLCDLGETRLFGYSLGYDLTMWIKDLPDEAVHEILRPELRNRTLPDGRTVRRGARYQGFEIDYLRRRVALCRASFNPQTRRIDRSARVVVWDVFGFYQSSFVKSLGDWRTATKDRIAEIDRMKRQRQAFAHLTPREVQAYCDDECKLLARLVRQLVEAHEEARLPLRSFYGAGSTASALLDRMGTRDHKGPDLPPDLLDAARRAFFGGRFELSRVGPVPGPVWNYDISSAYPYEATRLPCLACGAWRRYTGAEADRRAREGRLALLRCRVRQSGPTSWGPLPWRCPPVGSSAREEGLLGGAIVWPMRADETWCWREEYLAARDTIWPGVEALEAWVYDCDCAHAPFGLLPEIYRERCRIGKEGAGIVLKLGPNSVYGKTAQSIGKAPYKSWVWAGCITSGCRAKILRAIAAARDPASVIMVATDGILSAERLTLPAPEDTGTWDCVVKGRPTPLGGWEEKEITGGVFVARPGIYWPLGAGGEVMVKSRGAPRAVLGGLTCPDHRGRVSSDPGACPACLACGRLSASGCEGHDHVPCGRDLVTQSSLIEAHFAERGWGEPYDIQGIVRFVGATSGVRQNPNGSIVRSDSYGCWKPVPLQVSFDPIPKRAKVRNDHTLAPWPRMPGPSAPYDKKHRCPEGKLLEQLQRMLQEQPEGEYVIG